MRGKLSKSELDIMAKLWEMEEPIYFNDIVDSLVEYEWTESTIRNFLARIVSKGYLEVDKEGRKNIYRVKVSKEYVNKNQKGMLEKLYNNSIKNFIAELYESDTIDEDDLIELKEYLDEKIKNY